MLTPHSLFQFLARYSYSSMTISSGTWPEKLRKLHQYARWKVRKMTGKTTLLYLSISLPRIPSTVDGGGGGGCEMEGIGTRLVRGLLEEDRGGWWGSWT
jgi:hypothetical protein